MSRLSFFQQTYFAAFLLHLFKSTIQHSPSERLKGRSTCNSNQASLLRCDIERCSKSHFPEVESEIESQRTCTTRRQKSHPIDHLSEMHTAERMEIDENAVQVAKEESDLDFFIAHLQPHLWPWENQDIRKQTSRDIAKSAMEEHQGRGIEDGGEGSQVSRKQSNFQYLSGRAPLL
ncbi:hypothetical protein DFH28DRAFT_957998 [Melampsora americana]|nr:hypothetical protein DFH28DRAFT_957998 [Melampsora americana]